MQTTPSKKRPRPSLKLEISPSAQKVSSPASSRSASKSSSLSKAISVKIQKRSPASLSRAGPFGDEAGPSPNMDPIFNSFHFPPADMTVMSQDSMTGASLSGTDPADMPLVTTGAAQQIHRLDAIMFPSDDPLAYPNQPRVDFGMLGSNLHHASPGDVLPHNPSSYYVPQPQLYDGIEGQLLGPLPPYLMHSQGNPGLPFAGNMYSDPMISSHPMHPLMHRPHPQGLQMEQEQLRQQTRDYDQMLATTPWQGMFPQHGMQ